MKKIALWSMLFCLCATSGYAQRADVAKSTKEQKQEAKAVQGDILFKTAVEAIKARNFVWEFYNPRSTDKSKVCYNFMTIEGDSIYFQAAWSTQGRMQEGFRQSVGKIEQLTMTPDKKGNMKVYMKADMTDVLAIEQIDASQFDTAVVAIDVQSSWRTTWTLTSSFKLFKGSNAAPWMGGWEGYIVLPSQANVTRLSGSMPLNIPQGFIK